MRRSAAIAAAAAIGGTAAAVSFRRDLNRARARLAGRSRQFESSLGRVEYAVEGEGAPLLMVHGSGGGFDQGLEFAAPLVEAGRRVIAPSRFGYLGSAFPDEPTPARQADVFAELLDGLGIDRLPVCGGSAGALSAIQFALRHPDRCTALVLVVPAAWAPGRTPSPWTPAVEQAVMAVLGSDLLFWALMKAAPGLLIGTVLATDPDLLDRVGEAERKRARDILRHILPVSARRRGIAADTSFAGHPEPAPVEAIRAPTLILSVEDDRYGTADAARDLAARIPDADLVLFLEGGHLWLGHQGALWRRVNSFLRRVAGRS